MIAVWIIGVLFIIAGYFVGDKTDYKHTNIVEKLRELCWIVRNSTGTGKQSVRVRYKNTVNGVEFIGKSEWLNNGVFIREKFMR